MFQRQGGGCFVINSFIKVVLQNLGYQAYLIERCLPGTKRTGTEGHIGLIVQNVTHHGSKHLMEPGTRHPILQLIPLNFARVSPEYNLGHYSIRLFKDVSGIVHLCRPTLDDNIDDNDTMNFEGKKWEILITYRTLRSLSIEDCEKETNNILQDRNLMPELHDKLIIFGFSQGRWTAVVGRNFVQYGSRPGLATRKVMKNNAEMVETICKHFPQYPKERVAEVLMFWYPDRHVV
ncbi:hypothetical protein HOLleu_39150 [Holothuria leucospilota]|uniref:Arylamine N-acetyltransferase n=1 Tax=Holothuria leucospilota TaxID=206669 RepID=A0A9Q0YI84_HOLLE|nr:hypothetical protein HOLleu_39150 [Holothuria leucospilota]